MKNITFCIDDTILEKAQVKAKLNNTSLNSLFQDWLKSYVNNIYSLELDDFYKRTNACTDCGFTRDELNQR
jgi:hypothetical protein